jgi:hypothetical protein
MGLAFLADGLESRLWPSILGVLGVFYGAVGTLWLGATSDAFLAIGALLLLWGAWSRQLRAVVPSPSH